MRRFDGHYLGRLELPAPVNLPYPPPYVTDTHLYDVTPGDFGVELVVRVRLDKPLGWRTRGGVGRR